MSVVIHLVYGPSGEYDTYYEELIGAFLKRENAEKAGNEWFQSKTNPKDLPMSLEKFEELNFGYADDDYDEEGPRGRDGFTEEDFNKMDSVWENQYESFYDPIYKEVEISDISELKDLF